MVVVFYSQSFYLLLLLFKYISRQKLHNPLMSIPWPASSSCVPPNATMIELRVVVVVVQTMPCQVILAPIFPVSVWNLITYSVGHAFQMNLIVHLLTYKWIFQIIIDFLLFSNEVHYPLRLNYLDLFLWQQFRCLCPPERTKRKRIYGGIPAELLRNARTDWLTRLNGSDHCPLNPMRHNTQANSLTASTTKYT